MEIKGKNSKIIMFPLNPKLKKLIKKCNNIEYKFVFTTQTNTKPYKVYPL